MIRLVVNIFYGLVLLILYLVIFIVACVAIVLMFTAPGCGIPFVLVLGFLAFIHFKNIGVNNIKKQFNQVSPKIPQIIPFNPFRR
jgi:hypothetical protein